jgi:hypothetical protein
MLQTKVAEKIKHTLYSVNYYSKFASFIMLKESTVDPDRPQMAVQYGACACMLGNCGYKHTFIISNTYCFFHGKNGYANATQ